MGVTNIQKITQSMKMVSAAKFARAEKDLKSARPLGTAAQAFYQQAEVNSTSEAPKELYVAMTSDRGLAGAVHSSINKKIRGELHDKMAAGDDLSNIKVGSEIGRLPPQFGDAAKVANAILTCGHEFDTGKLVYNYYRSVVSYDTTEIPIFSLDTVSNAEKVTVYDSLDADVVQPYMEFSLASLVYYTMKEGATSEQSSRMTAMDNSSKNASEMIDKLRISFNRTRQAVITGELIEIISGAAAL